MKSSTPIIEIEMAESDSMADLGIGGPTSLRLLPGECAIIEGMHEAQLYAVADLCSGLVGTRSGKIKYLGYEWATLPHEFAAALRGRIGRVFARGGWLPFLDAETNVLLPQLHHSRRQRRELRAEATVLAHEFGLPGLPQGQLADLSSSDLAKSILVRAFLGDPRLIILEKAAVVAGIALLNRLASVRDRGGAVVWLIQSHTIGDARALAADRWLRITSRGLAEVRHSA
jgi:phospholipid/cholesterol/gamma-HCH transport system ATP-binding protein